MRIRILLLALVIHQSWAHPTHSHDSTAEGEEKRPQRQENSERDGDSSKKIIGSSVVTSVSVILNGNEPEFTDALGVKVPKPQLPHLQVASPINLLNPDRYEFYTFDDNGELVKRLMTMEEIQSIVANGDGDGPTIIHAAPFNDRDPEKNVQDIVKSVQNVLSREVESNKNNSEVQPILDTPDVSSSWSMILPAIFGNTGGEIFPQSKPQQVVMTPDSDVFEATTKSNKRKPSNKPKPSKKKTGSRRKTTTKRIPTTTMETPEDDLSESTESTTRKVFINNQEVVQSSDNDRTKPKRPTSTHRRPTNNHSSTKKTQSLKNRNKTSTRKPNTTTVLISTTMTLETPTTIFPFTTEKLSSKNRKKPSRKSTTPIPHNGATTHRQSAYNKRKSTSPKPAQEQKIRPVQETNTIPPSTFTTAATLVSKPSIPFANTTQTTKTVSRIELIDTDSYTTTSVSPQASVSNTTFDSVVRTTVGAISTTHAPFTTPSVLSKTEAPTSISTVSTSTSSTTATPTLTTTSSTVAPTTIASTTKVTTPTPTPASSSTTTTTALPTTISATTPSVSTITSTTITSTTSPTTPYFNQQVSQTTHDSLTKLGDYPSPTTPTISTDNPPDISEDLQELHYGEDNASLLKHHGFPKPGTPLTEREEDLTTKFAFDQILQSLKKESATDSMVEASEPADVQNKQPNPPINYQPMGVEPINETPSPMTTTTEHLEDYVELDEHTQRPDSMTSDEFTGTTYDVVEHSSPSLAITNHQEMDVSNIPLDTTPQVEATTTSSEVSEEEVPVTNESINNEDSQHVIRFEPLYADVSEPIVTTFTTTTTEPSTTLSDKEDLDTTEETDTSSTLAANNVNMADLMHRIDTIISMSLKATTAPDSEIQTNYSEPAMPHLDALEMKVYQSQAATVASMLEDNYPNQSNEAVTMNSVEAKDEMESLLSDVINQMTQSQNTPPIYTTPAFNATTMPTPIESETEPEDETVHRLTNFAQINPALKESLTVNHPIVDHSIDEDPSVSNAAIQPQPLTEDLINEEVSTTTLVAEEISESDSNTTLELGESTTEVSEENLNSVESVTEHLEQTVVTSTQRVSITSIESSSETAQITDLERTTLNPMPDHEHKTIEASSEEELGKGSDSEDSTEIPENSAVILTDSEMEDSNESSQITTILPLISHLMHGEDPYIKLGEAATNTTQQSLKEELSDEMTSSSEPFLLETEESQKPTTAEVTDVSKVEAEPNATESNSDKQPEIVENLRIATKSDEKSPEEKSPDTDPEQSLDATEYIPSTTEAQPAEEDALLTTLNPAQNSEPDETLTLTELPSSTIVPKKPSNTLKPVSYFNMQPDLVLPDQKLSYFQMLQQRPVVRPPSLSNLMMPQTGLRAPVKLEPSPPNSLGLEESVANLDEDIREFTLLCNELAFTYWRSITAEKISSARSLVISPFALTSMLSMMFLGARGSTSGEMNEILKLDDMVSFNPHLVFKNITETVEGATDSAIASSAFVREAFSDRSNGKILQFFKEKTQQLYSGHVEEVNFNVVNDIIRRRTNLLIKRHTMGKVSEYLRTNSVWVNGPLATVSANLFQTDCSYGSVNDRDGEMFFQVHPSIRQRRLVPIPAVVYRSGFLAGYEPKLDATVVSFGKPIETVSVIYIIPGQQNIVALTEGLEELENNLVDTAFSKNTWKGLLTTLSERPGLEVQLPRFSHRSFVNASMGLQRMGLKGLFKSEVADLRGLTGLAAKDVYLSDMIQINTFSTCGEEKISDHHHVEMYPAPPIRKRNKDVGEKQDPNDDSSESIIDFGSIVQDTVMARAFYDELLDPKFLELPLPLRPRQARIPDAPRIRFDRPFLYFVRHNPTGMILFMGRFNPRLLP